MTIASTINPNGLKVLVKNYLHESDLSIIDRAWSFVLEVHDGKRHFSGEPFIMHCLEVASTLASMHLDLDTILSGLLHGVLKEGVTVDELREKFGDGVASIVDGSTRIANVHYNNKLTHQAENIRKMLLAIAADIRVLLVKLVDRLQDMCLLDLVVRDVQREIAKETMDLYAPLASRLGIDWLKRELEDLSFKFLHPEEFLELSTKLESSLEERQRYVEEVISILQQKLIQSNIHPIRIIGRPKHLYSIYKKIIAQNIPLDKVYDKVAFRIIVATVKECYESLGVVHADWAPVHGRIKDFISAAKSNNYQSIHTTVVGPHDNFIEIQIRTEEMDRIAQEGVAAHWAYKEGQKIDSRDAKLFKELKKLVKSLQEVEDPREFLESVRGELYEPEVYALTPGGEVKEFPQKSCPIDFAFAVHSEVGDHCVGAKVNGRLVPLKYQLQNGDIVEIITSPNQTPRRGWLEIVKTSRARSRIRSWLRREEKEKALKLGREICERELKKYETTLKKMVKGGHIRLLLKQLHCNSLDDMLVKVGSGTITVQNLVRFLQPPELLQEKEIITKELSPEQIAMMMVTQSVQEGQESGSSIRIDGIDDMLVKISQCCNPVPGDPIVGFITTGRGVSIHKVECANLLSTDPRRWLEVSWSGKDHGQHRVELHVSAQNRRGIFTEISSVISADNVNIIEISAHTTPDDIADLRIAIEVENLGHLQVVIQHLRQMKHVLSVRRT
jgi:GTP diphosphokinase / guanosine-3',5'-bis(diphosphate) 3'-diphosphatase